MTVPVTRIPLRRFDDERGWFMELMRASALPKPVRQSNVVFSRQGVIRGLHYHERGQDDLFACLSGMVRVVVLDRESGETFTEDIGDDNPVAVYVPGRHAHGYEALTDCLFLYHVTQEYDVLEGFWGDAGESIDAYYEVNDFVRANGANRDAAWSTASG